MPEVNVRTLLRTLGIVLLLCLVGCGGSDQSAAAKRTMPAVAGKQLDVALDDIKHAGVKDKVDVKGGGVLGIIDKSNWTVCQQTPPAGSEIVGVPSLSVERSCKEPGVTTAASSSSTTGATSSTTTTVEPTTTQTSLPVLTRSTNADLKAVLSLTDYCDPRVEKFAATYGGRVIEFDGNISNMAPHGSSKTRYDILIGVGDFSTTKSIGPAFQFPNVGISDLHLTGPNVPDHLAEGDNLHVVAKVVSYEKTRGCLFLLDPVTTQLRS